MSVIMRFQCIFRILGSVSTGVYQILIPDSYSGNGVRLLRD